MKNYLAHLIGPAMEYRDIAAGEKPCDVSYVEIEANSEEEAWNKARKLAEERGEGEEVREVEETFE